MKKQDIGNQKNEPEQPIFIAMTVNFLIMLLYLVSTPDNAYGTKATWIFIHFVAALIISVIFISNKKTEHIGKAIGLTALTIPVIGFGLCLVTADIKSLAK